MSQVSKTFIETAELISEFVPGTPERMSDLLRLAHSVTDLWESEMRGTLHEVLVSVARQDSQVIHYLNASQKINAIKRLRHITGTGLKAAKEAVEDPRVKAASLFVVVGGGTVDTAATEWVAPLY